MSNATLPAVYDGHGHDHAPSLVSGVGAVTSAIEQIKSLRTFINAEMIAGIDFGTIPGTGDKKTLLLPGAQKTALYFNTAARFENDRAELGGGHLEVLSRCHLVSRASDRVMAEGFGSCSTMESKYRWRKGERTCPRCGCAAIIKGKEEYGGGWVCFNKKGGCGAKFSDRDPDIISQAVGRAENPDIYDVRNTVLKIAMKRAQVAAALALGAMAELFTQDMEDFYDITAAPAEAAVSVATPARDAGRDEVNAAFRNPPEASQRPRQDGPRQPDRQPPPEDWARWSARTLKEANDAWRNEQAVELRLHASDRTDLDTNAHRLTNHLVTAAIGTEKPDGGGPLVLEENVLNGNGKRDRELVKDCASWLFAEHHEWAVAETGRYLEGKRSEALEKVRHEVEGDGNLDLPAEPGSNG
jgi:hypothetical protein